MEKQLKEAEKQLRSNADKREKLAGKVENSKKEEKRLKLERELQTLEAEGRELRSDRDRLVRSLEEYRVTEIETTLPKRRFELIQRLSYMSLKWERSRQIDIHDIYRD